MSSRQPEIPLAKKRTIIIIIMGGSYIAHFTNVPMRFTISGGLFRAAYNMVVITLPTVMRDA
jgi:hypothetical protein